MMNKWIVFGLTTLCSVSSFVVNAFDENINSKNNPASMSYYVEHYQAPSSQEYQYLLVSVRTAADTMNFYTTRLDARNQRIDYCLPMKNSGKRENLYYWKTKEIMTLINNHIEIDPSFKKYGKAGVRTSIGSYLVAALKEQYPCPVQKQL